MLSVTAENMSRIMESYGDMLYRICLIMLKNETDAEDAVQESFIAYMKKTPQFQSDEHEKAWLIRVATNKCRDIMRFRKRNETVSDELLENYMSDEESTEVVETLMLLPEKIRIVMLLHYVEGYKVEEIAKIIGKTQSAVKMRLAKGRKLFEESYRKEYLNEN